MQSTLGKSGLGFSTYGQDEMQSTLGTLGGDSNCNLPPTSLSANALRKAALASASDMLN